MLRREKILGMLVGGAIGDAWGMPAETMTPESIKKHYPQGIIKYEKPDHNKYLKGKLEAGCTTDDTALTKATMSSLTNGLNMNSQALHHILAWDQDTLGWGKTTSLACEYLKEGVSYKESGKNAAEKLLGKGGKGNGVLMKCSPLGAYFATEAGGKERNFNQFCSEYAAMTHYNAMSAYACVCHANVIHGLLHSNPSDFDPELHLLDLACDVAFDWANSEESDHIVYRTDHLHGGLGGIKASMSRLWSIRRDLKSMTPNRIAEEFGCRFLLGETLPFCYAMFCKNPYSAYHAGYDTIHQGGDSDTNAKIVLEMVGALNGIEIFKTLENQWMIEGLIEYDDLCDLAEEFCDVYGVK